MGVLDQFKLDGQVAVVTGGGRGIGEGIAIGLAEAGADVVVAARRTEEVEAVAEKVRALGRRAAGLTCDVMDMEQVTELANKVKADMGKLTCWVSNAGGADDRVPRTLLDMPERQWDFQLNLNLKAVWSGAQAAGRIMQENGGGTIVNISSVAANRASANNGPYAVAKSGVNNLTQTLAVEMAPLGIRVNGVSPGNSAGPGRHPGRHLTSGGLSGLRGVQLDDRPYDSDQRRAIKRHETAHWPAHWSGRPGSLGPGMGYPVFH